MSLRLGSLRQISVSFQSAKLCHQLPTEEAIRLAKDVAPVRYSVVGAGFSLAVARDFRNDVSAPCPPLPAPKLIYRLSAPTPSGL